MLSDGIVALLVLMAISSSLALIVIAVSLTGIRDELGIIAALLRRSEASQDEVRFP